MTKINGNLDYKTTGSQRRCAKVKISQHHLLAAYQFSRGAKKMHHSLLRIDELISFTKESDWILNYKSRSHLWIRHDIVWAEILCVWWKGLIYKPYQLYNIVQYTMSLPTLLSRRQSLHASHNASTLNMIFTCDPLEPIVPTLHLQTYWWFAVFP